MEEPQYPCTNYLIKRIETNISETNESFPEKEIFFRAFHEIYLFKTQKKFGEIANALAKCYFNKDFSKNQSKDYLHTYEKVLADLSSLCKKADEIYNYPNKNKTINIQEFYKNSIEKIVKEN